MKYQPFDSEQLAELERRLTLAEKEQSEQVRGKEIISGPAMREMEFQALYYIRRLLEDLKMLRHSTIYPSVIIGPNTQSGYNSKGDYGEFAVPDYIAPELTSASSPARIALWFKTWEEASAFSAAFNKYKA